MKRLAIQSFLVLAWTALLAGAVTLSDIEKQLMCMCGCGMVLSSCQCGTAEEFRAEIQAKLDQGIPPNQIIQDFVARYGETVLAAPTKSGFNLTAWVTPFVAVLLGLFTLFWIVRALAQRHRLQTVPPPPETRHPGFQKRLEERLKDYL